MISNTYPTVSTGTSHLIRVDNIIGTSEVAAILGCPKQQVYALRKRKDFPLPVHHIAASPIWDASAIAAFARTWVRRKASKTQ